MIVNTYNLYSIYFKSLDTKFPSFVSHYKIFEYYDIME